MTMDLLVTKEASIALTGVGRRAVVIPVDKPTFERINNVRHYGETFSETLIRLAEARKHMTLMTGMPR